MPDPTCSDRLPFRAVNRCGSRGYVSGLQRHHLLPRQLLSYACFTSLFDSLGKRRIDLDDFRSNGLLLPSCDAEAIRIGLPLHRGPHHSYNAMVIARVGQVEVGWAANRLKQPEMASNEALMRMRLVQRALRRSLLDTARRRHTLNCRDPLGKAADFTALDAMADTLWGETG